MVNYKLSKMRRELAIVRAPNRCAKVEELIWLYNIHILTTADRWKNRQESLQAQDLDK